MLFSRASTTNRQALAALRDSYKLAAAMQLLSLRTYICRFRHRPNFLSLSGVSYPKTKVCRVHSSRSLCLAGWFGRSEKHGIVFYLLPCLIGFGVAIDAVTTAQKAILQLPDTHGIIKAEVSTATAVAATVP